MMNKRIRQLAEQAGLRFTQLMSNPMVPVVDGKETDLAKFAELIVQECRTVINDVYHKTPLELCGPLLTVDEEIMNHFYGVEKLT
jgi:hypothetical protein